MKNFRAKRGPFAERPYYEQGEIESMCLDELRKADLLPAQPEPIRIERFIEKRFRVQPRYDDLPDGVLGFTRFGSKGVEAIVVARVLADEGSRAAERRINTTLAHEAGHGLLHAHLFALGALSPSLFGDAVDPAAPRILCRDDAVSGTSATRTPYDGRWWEYQANRVIGALLLPKPLVRICLAPLAVSRGNLGQVTVDNSRRDEAVRLIADTFEVNPAVARIRLDEVLPAGNDRQLSL